MTADVGAGDADRLLHSEEPAAAKPSPLPRLRFPRAARLTRPGEFRRVREQGRSWPGRYLILGVLREPSAPPAPARIGLVTSRRIGGAVERNRVRRWLREAVRATRPRLRPGAWIVLIARSGAARAGAMALAQEWLRLAGRAGLLPNHPPVRPAAP